MSHVATIDLHIKDLEALKLACREIGLEFKEGQKTYRWYGRHVGDYALPEGTTANDLGKCSHAISVAGNARAYEVGVCERTDGKPGYRLLWDFYLGGFGLEKIVGRNAGLLKQQYAAQVAMKQLRKQGMRVSLLKQADGSLKVIAKH